MNLKTSLIIGALNLGSLVALNADTSVLLSNPDFGSGTTGYTSFVDNGNSGTYNATTNPYGSSGIMYGVGTGSTAGFANAPASTEGQFTLDAGDVADPGGPYPSTSIIFHNSPYVRIQSTSGELGEFYEDTGVKFAQNTTYTFSAYVAGAGHGNSNDSFLGVGLSANTNLTLDQVETNNGFTPVDGFNSDGTPNESAGIVGPTFSSSVALTENPGSTFTLQTVTINTQDDTSLIGKDVILNLLALSDPYYGDGQYFTGLSLSYALDTAPEPSTYVLGGLGLLLLVAHLRRRSLQARA